MAENLIGVEVERQESESRFGDKDATIDLMRSGEPHLVGSVDELYPDEISTHSNLVEIVQFLHEKYSQREDSNNVTEPVLIHRGSETPLLCIFKPYDGENPKTKEDHGIKSFYPREMAAYMLSEHLRLDLVPPTTIREVNGRIGALQLFLEPPQYVSGERFFQDYTDEEWGKIQSSADFQAIAAFDYIIGNTDRKDANILVRVDEKRRLALKDDQPELVAIDHGLSMDTVTLQYFEAMGPMLGLTYDNVSRKPRNVPLPSSLKEKLADGYQRKEAVDFSLLPDIPHQEVANLWSRTKHLIDTGSFLSPENLKLFIKK